MMFEKRSLVAFNSNYPAPNTAAGANIYLEMLSEKISVGVFLKPCLQTNLLLEKVLQNRVQVGFIGMFKR